MESAIDSVDSKVGLETEAEAKGSDSRICFADRRGAGYLFIHKLKYDSVGPST